MAIAPTTWYCPPTRSPGFSFGENENSWPHCGQSPGAPGTAVDAAPDGLPHLEQVRLSSGTCGSGLIALLASTGGAGGTTVSPAPNWAARTRCEPVRVRRVAVVPPDCRSREPMAAEPTRLDEVATDTSLPLSGWDEKAAAASAAAPAAGTGRRAADVAVAVEDGARAPPPGCRGCRRRRQWPLQTPAPDRWPPGNRPGGRPDAGGRRPSRRRRR